jgi:hypothetical protein
MSFGGELVGGCEPPRSQVMASLKAPLKERGYNCAAGTAQQGDENGRERYIHARQAHPKRENRLKRAPSK